MVRWIITGMLLLSSAVLYAADEVDVNKWANGSEYALYTLIVADGLQTRQIRDHAGIYEKNAYICGKNPEDACILAWFGAKLAGVWWLNNQAALTPIRRYNINMFLSAWTLTVVNSNLKLGLEIKF